MTEATVAAGAASRPVLLEVQAVHKRFAGVHALRGIDLRIEAGQIYHLLGENGCGKSTLIKIISGAQPPSEGRLVVDGVPHDALTPLQALALGIETVYQDLSLLPNLSVAENVALSEQMVHGGGRLARRFDRKAVRATAARALAAVRLPADPDFLETQVDELPVATRQLLAIARAIATRARMVIMDEPTTALTQREVDNLIQVVEGLRAQGVAVLFVSHKLDECIAIGGQAIVFRDGAKVAEGPIAGFSKADLAFWMTGKRLDGARYAGSAPTTRALLEVRDFGRGTQFSDVRLAVHAGEVLGITGLLDSGRNELAQALAGVRPADRGEMLLDGRAVVLASPGDAITHGIGYVPEDRLSEGLFLDRSIHDNIITAVIGRLRGRFGALDEARCAELSARTVADLKIATPDVTRPVQSLSGGNQQRVLIGRWLAIAPRVLILHGPTVGVDVGSKDTIYRIVQTLAEKGLGVILVSDDLPELLQNCHRILLMRKGRVAREFEADGLAESTLYRSLVSEDDAAPAARTPVTTP
jgi:simple sugar transport system ATP-binding protein